MPAADQVSTGLFDFNDDDDRTQMMFAPSFFWAAMLRSESESTEAGEF